MTRIKTRTFFAMHNIVCTEEAIEKYNDGWTLDEIKKWDEYIRKNYEEEIRCFNEIR